MTAPLDCAGDGAPAPAPAPAPASILAGSGDGIAGSGRRRGWTAGLPGPMSSMLALLEFRAMQTPSSPLVRIDGHTYSYADVYTRVRAVAAALLAFGIVPGDRVAIVADNCIECLVLWLASNWISAVDAPINTHLRGGSLTRVLAALRPATVVCTRTYLAELAPVVHSLPSEPSCVLADDLASGANAADVPGSGALPGAIGERERPGPGSAATIMYTSGTTGASKGVIVPHGYYPWYGTIGAGLAAMDSHDRMFCCQPLYHIDGRLAVMTALASGGSVALQSRFSATSFWADLRAAAATRFLYVGAMLWILHKHPARADDASQPASIGLGSSTPGDIQREFERRFCTRLIDTFGMTEGVLLTGSPAGDAPPGTMGRPLPGADLTLVDEHDAPVPVGQVGQIVFRPRYPGTMPLGYWENAAATVQAWQNLWFHTGDLAVEDSKGYWTYAGRTKDVIRMRGENISAWDVEQAFLRLAPVAGAAAFGVPSPVGEEDLAVLIMLRPGEQPDAAALCDAVAWDVPRFMVPRYVEFVDELPTTSSHRVEKATVRARGITLSTWDASVAGWHPPPGRPAGRHS